MQKYSGIDEYNDEQTLNAMINALRIKEDLNCEYNDVLLFGKDVFIKITINLSAFPIDFCLLFFFLWKKKNEKKPQENDIQHVFLLRPDIAFVLL